MKGKTRPRPKWPLLRAATAFALVWLVAGILHGGATMAKQLSLTADGYIEQRCTFCHSRILTIVLLNRRVGMHGIQEMDSFLIRHHLPEAAARETIIRYLEGGTPQGAED